MQVKGSGSDPVQGSALYAYLRERVVRADHTEVAVALAASDLGGRQEPVSRDEAVGFAVQGLSRIGTEAMRERARELRAVALADIALQDRGVSGSDPRRRELTRQERDLWGGVSARQQDRCRSVAWDVDRVAPATYVPDPRVAAEAAERCERAVQRDGFEQSLARQIAARPVRRNCDELEDAA